MPSMRLSPLPAVAAFAARVLTLALLGVLVLGCDDVTESETAVTATPQASRAPALPRIKWLDADGGVTPERWLASRAAQADLAETDPSVAAMHQALDDAAKQFSDPPRMIANRAVQLEGMLAAQGIDESAPELIETLSRAVARADRKEGFGSVCQHYFYLRQQGVGREAALQQLKEARLARPGNRVLHG